MIDRIFAVVWLAFCAAVAWLAWQFQAQFSYEPIGPRAFPLLLAGLMAASAAWLVVKPSPDAPLPQGALRGKLALLVAAFVAYAFLFEWLGFPLATALAAVAVGRLYGGRWVPCLVAGVAMGVGFYFFFDRVLDVTLPAGRIFGAR
jgi:putative tricarboxylic transport membrane protein